MRCMKCGNIINDGVQFCPECGSKVERSCRSCGAVDVYKRQIHNHPSGDAEPSREDVLLTQKISAAGKILGLPLLDHIIVGEYGYYSFKEQGKLEQVLPDDAA